MARPPKKPPPYPTDSLLHEAALSHLARYAATRAGLLRVLDRKVMRWAASEAGDPDQAATARAAARQVVERLTASGVVSDKAFAEARSRSLSRAGKSARAIGAHLSSRGVGAELARQSVVVDADRELAAACIHVRRKRLGDFRAAETAPEQHRRDLASLARAGFSHGVAKQALLLSRDDAEALITQFRDAL
jgi:regulatory protein